MKKLLRNALMLSAMGSVLFFTSCDDEGEETGSNPTVSVDVVDEQESYAVGESFSLDVSFTASSDVVASTIDMYTEEAEFTISINGGGISADIIDLNFFDVAGVTEGSFTINGLSVPEEAENTTLTIDIMVEDNQGRSAIGSVDLEIETAIAEFQQQLLGGPLNATTGSFFNAFDGEVYSASQAFEADNTSKNDFVFWYGSTSLYAIGAVDDERAQTAFDEQTNGAVQLENLNPRSISRFKTFVGDIDYENINSNSELVNAYNGDGTADLSRVTELTPGDVFGIVLDEGRGSRIGLIQVVSIDGTSGTTRSITIDVKIQTINN